MSEPIMTLPCQAACPACGSRVAKRKYTKERDEHKAIEIANKMGSLMTRYGRDSKEVNDFGKECVAALTAISTAYINNVCSDCAFEYKTIPLCQ